VPWRCVLYHGTTSTSTVGYGWVGYGMGAKNYSSPSSHISQSRWVSCNFWTLSYQNACASSVVLITFVVASHILGARDNCSPPRLVATFFQVIMVIFKMTILPLLCRLSTGVLRIGISMSVVPCEPSMPVHSSCPTCGYCYCSSLGFFTDLTPPPLQSRAPPEALQIQTQLPCFACGLWYGIVQGQLGFNT
jgi:hypothetical protein